MATVWPQGIFFLYLNSAVEMRVPLNFDSAIDLVNVILYQLNNKTKK